MRKTVLVAEDDFLIAMDLKETLENLGWEVIGPVATVNDALRLLEERLPSIALLDVNLGREMATPVAEMLKQLNVPFVLASAHHQPELFAGAIFAGAINLGKPASERRLQTVLARLTDV